MSEPGTHRLRRRLGHQAPRLRRPRSAAVTIPDLLLMCCSAGHPGTVLGAPCLPVAGHAGPDRRLVASWVLGHRGPARARTGSREVGRFGPEVGMAPHVPAAVAAKTTTTTRRCGRRLGEPALLTLRGWIGMDVGAWGADRADPGSLRRLGVSGRNRSVCGLWGAAPACGCLTDVCQAIDAADSWWRCVMAGAHEQLDRLDGQARRQSSTAKFDGRTRRPDSTARLDGQTRRPDSTADSTAEAVGAGTKPVAG